MGDTITNQKKDVETIAKTSFIVWELAKTTKQKVEAGKAACDLILGLLAKQRKGLFAKVRERVVGEKEKQFPSGYQRNEIKIRNEHREDQLEKLNELEKGVE